MELDTTEMTKRFVMAGLGASFLRFPTAGRRWAPGSCARSPCAEPMLRRLALIYRKDKALSKAALGLSRQCWIIRIASHDNTGGDPMKTNCRECGRCSRATGARNAGIPSRRIPVAVENRHNLISTGTGEGIYRSLAEVPQPLRESAALHHRSQRRHDPDRGPQWPGGDIPRAGTAPAPWRAGRPNPRSRPPPERRGMWWRASAMGVLALAVILLWLAMIRG